MRAVSLNEDALLVTSAFWQTNAVAVRAGGETLLIDSPYLPNELEALPGVLAGAGFEADGLLATHGDFDHLLGRYAYPGMSLGVGESTALRFREQPGEAQRDLRAFDAEFYVERPGPLALGSFQSLPVPGRLDLGKGEGAAEIELHPAEGHTSDGTAFFLRSLGVIVLGDYVSAVEIPWISGSGSLEDYLATLARLEPLIAEAQVVVPGHGPSHVRDDALRLLAEDVAYLEELKNGNEGVGLPAGRDSRPQKKIHSENVERAGGGSAS